MPERKFRLLKTYLERIPGKEFPHHIFTHAPEERQEKRLSQLSMNLLKIIKLTKQNYANKLAELALKTSPNTRRRHKTIQDFMLINDSVTIACEVPVYLTGDDIKYFQQKGFLFSFKDYRTPITGHIDLLQIRNRFIHILDYKPEAKRTNPIEQLIIYALALSRLTGLRLYEFKCACPVRSPHRRCGSRLRRLTSNGAWFDDKDYYEFFPLHAVYKKR